VRFESSRNGAAIAKRAAQEFVQAATLAVREKGSIINAVLAGDRSPKALYSLLVNDPTLRSQVPWDKIHLFIRRRAVMSHPTIRTAIFAWRPKR